MLFKLLLLGGFIAAVYYAFFNKKSLPNNPSKENKKPQEPMIACAKCGTYTDVKETFIRDGYYYCSRECMEA
jgi:uncharacterized protein